MGIIPVHKLLEVADFLCFAACMGILPEKWQISERRPDKG